MLSLTKQAIAAALQLIAKGNDTPPDAVIDALLARELVRRVGKRLEVTPYGKSYCRSMYTPAWH
ncbi:hypothetical protein PIN31009_03838 [Pandoraea iniqua]|uniref:Uncharacterized protein n=1 Tax=Pandoraea iniqua TaxID=2508288 RepID=A0A5E4XG46_9BURK|nr:hypothetical protein [Pandoraea iniqua]VVE35202.1 hypothetical protein PIN31009_03838 [Pandoraea iniqua]VVE39380.1 hypothetical protein PIN31115_04056 [Pandoraea iniqua]